MTWTERVKEIKDRLATLRSGRMFSETNHDLANQLARNDLQFTLDRISELEAEVERLKAEPAKCDWQAWAGVVELLKAEVAALREDREKLREIITQSEMCCNHPDEAEELTPDSEPAIGLCSGDACVYCACLHLLDAAKVKERGRV